MRDSNLEDGRRNRGWARMDGFAIEPRGNRGFHAKSPHVFTHYFPDDCQGCLTSSGCEKITPLRTCQKQARDRTSNTMMTHRERHRFRQHAVTACILLLLCASPPFLRGANRKTPDQPTENRPSAYSTRKTRSWPRLGRAFLWHVEPRRQSTLWQS